MGNVGHRGFVEMYKGCQVYPADGGQYRWRRVDGNGRIIANGGEAFSSLDAVRRSIDNVVEEFREESGDDGGE